MANQRKTKGSKDPRNPKDPEHPDEPNEPYPEGESYDDPEEHREIERRRFSRRSSGDAGTVRARPRAVVSIARLLGEAAHGSSRQRSSPQ